MNQRAGTKNVSVQIIGFVNEIRRYLLFIAAAVLLVTLFYYLLSPDLLHFLQRHLNQRLAFFSVAEPFMAQVKLSLVAALFTLMPAIIYLIWKALARPFSITTGQVGLFTLFTCLLFYSGAMFCYSITLPFGVNFLLNFQSSQLKPIISVGRFVSFITIFLLAFGLIFELPVFMVAASRAGIIPRRTFEKNRRYAVLIISIIAALLTPTPDVVNMLLMGAPLYLLYELGILVLRMMRV